MSENIIDISFKDVSSAILSNLFPHEFSVDGITCKSMEGFLQSLKYKNQDIQKIVQGLWGLDAYKAGRGTDWRPEQVLYWKGQVLDRHGIEYQRLLDRAYGVQGEEGIITNPLFCNSLANSRGKILTHKGVDDPRETVLTPEEYISRLIKLRDNLLNKERETGFERE